MEVKDKLLLNGARYTGEIINDMPHGYGVYETNTIKLQKTLEELN